MLIKLFNRTYEVRSLDRKDDIDLLGQAEFKQGIIWIHSDIEPPLRARTILHELIHQGLADMGAAYAEDEGVVGNIEFLVSHIIQDNPSLIKDLSKPWQ